MIPAMAYHLALYCGESVGSGRQIVNSEAYYFAWGLLGQLPLDSEHRRHLTRTSAV